MYFNNNEYSIPIVLGTEKFGVAAAMKLLKLKRTRPHIFTDRIAMWHRAIFKCHIVFPFCDEWVLSSLVDFASELEEYYTPILLLTDDWSRSIAERKSDVLGARFIIVDAEEYFKGECSDDNE